jgi:thiol-disulfide isomerase/thioredoxin
MWRVRFGSALRHDGVRLAGVLLVAAAISVLYRDSGADAFAERNPVARRMMPEVGGLDLNGTAWHLADQRGSVVLVNFWASWCPPCRAETPALVRLSKTYGSKGLEVVGVSMDEDSEAARRFARQFQVPYPIIDPKTSRAADLAVESLPTSFLLDRKGRVAKTYIGAVTESELVRDVESLIAEP